MDIGLKIKNLRNYLNLTQEELADRCELSKGFISQLEHNKVSPSIENLETILEVLGITISDFFKEEKEDLIVFSYNEQNDKRYDSYLQTWLVPSAQKKMMEPIYVELDEGGVTEKDFPHEGEEFGYVIEGEIEIHYGDRSYAVKAGDSFYFEAKYEHYLKNISKKKSKIVWVSCPPTF